MRRIGSGEVARRVAASFLSVLALSCSSSSEPPPPVATVQLTPPNDTVLIGDASQLTATLLDADGAALSGRAVTWQSDRPNVATVSQTGLVTGVTDGTATISATSESKTGSAAVRVFDRCSTEIAPPITVGQTINASLAATDCQLTDDTYADGYDITVTTATNVQIDMTGSFDTFLILCELHNGELEPCEVNDDVDPDDPNDPNDPFDTNSRITVTLQPNVQYFIIANSFDSNTFGNYQLKVTAVAFVTGSAVVGKSGKAPVSALIKRLKGERK